MIFLVFILLILIGLIFNLGYKPLDRLSQQENDRQRISDLEKLKKALISYQTDTSQLPKLPEGKRFLVGGKGSPQEDKSNWLGVDLSEYLNLVPVDPKILSNATAPYPYRYSTDGVNFKLDAFLETNPQNLMQNDGGILNDPGVPLTNRARYEVGTNLSLRF